MKVSWTAAGWSDFDRLHAFLAEHDIDAADAILDKLANAPDGLASFPRRGARVSQFETPEVRELRVGKYLIRYELGPEEIYILRLFHSRENRF